MIARAERFTRWGAVASEVISIPDDVLLWPVADREECSCTRCPECRDREAAERFIRAQAREERV